jgi:AcrR family transcriptional regulator
VARTLSTAQERRETVIRGAVAAFAQCGYAGATYADVAERAGISVAYVYKLFPGKHTLFVAAVDRCFERIAGTFEQAAERAAGEPPGAVLDAMGAAYAELIADRDLLLLQVHAQAAAGVPEIRDALRRGLARTTEVVTSRSGAPPEDVRWFMAWGQLCHLAVSASLFDLDDAWATTLTDGLRHSQLPSLSRAAEVAAARPAPPSRSARARPL